MTTTEPDERTVKVGTRDLRRALAAVYPHREKRTALAHVALHRIRIEVDAPTTEPDRKPWLRCYATNGETTAAAVVEVVEDSLHGLFAADGVGHVRADLSPHDVDMLLKGFDVHRKTDTDAGDEQLELCFQDRYLFVEDVSGKRAGQLVRYPKLPDASEFPDLHAVSARAVQEVAGESAAARPVYTEGRIYSLFTAASTAYESPILLQPIGSDRGAGWLVRVGIRFVGTVPGELDNEHSVKRRSDEHMMLLQRFGTATPARELVDA